MGKYGFNLFVRSLDFWEGFLVHEFEPGLEWVRSPTCQIPRGSKFFIFEFDATLFGFDVNDKAPKELFDKHKSGETNTTSK